jgi:hypothetical protein
LGYSDHYCIFRHVKSDRECYRYAAKYRVLFDGTTAKREVVAKKRVGLATRFTQVVKVPDNVG